MELFDHFIPVTLLFLTLVSLASGIPLPLHHDAHHLVSRGLVSPTNAELIHNTIAFGVPALIAFALRIINRGLVLKKLHAEDYLMIGTMFFYIALMVLINVSANFGTNLYPLEQENSILADPSDVENRILGSKIVIALEQCMIASTWGVKLCIWTFEMRLFRQLPQYERAMWFLFVYIWVGFAFIEIFYYGVFCRPFDQYWAMPVQNLQCATYHNYSILQMVFNISSDFGLIIAPLPMVLKSQLPRRRKIVLFFIFSMALFTILAAILNKVYNFESPMTTVYQLWYIREASVAVCVGNLICTWQLFQRIFRLRTFNAKSAEIHDDPAMPRFVPHMRYSNPVRVAWTYLTTGGTDTRYQTATGGDSSLTTAEIPVGDEKGDLGEKEKKKENVHERHVTSTSYMMTLNRDGEGDARPALAFRDEHKIE